MDQRDGQRTTQQQTATKEDTRQRQNTRMRPNPALHIERSQEASARHTECPDNERATQTNKPTTKERESAKREGALISPNYPTRAACGELQLHKRGGAKMNKESTRAAIAERAGGTAIPADVHGLNGRSASARSSGRRRPRQPGPEIATNKRGHRAGGTAVPAGVHGLNGGSARARKRGTAASTATRAS